MFFRKNLMAVAIVICCLALFGATCSKRSPEPQTLDEKLHADHMRLMNEIRRAGVKDKLVLDAVREIRRHLFVDHKYWSVAYNDHPLPIGEDQTISQPSLVALMTELLELKGGEKVLEIGTGSGYQAAILAQIAGEVYTIEIVESLAKSAAERLKTLAYNNVTVRAGDGYKGWKEQAPFDAIIVTCGAPEILQPLVDQLRDGGVMVSPVGEDNENSVLKKIVKRGDKIEVKDITGVAFVPMTGEVQEKKKQR